MVSGELPPGGLGLFPWGAIHRGVNSPSTVYHNYVLKRVRKKEREKNCF